MKKYDTAIFFLLAVLILSIPTSFAFASEDNDDDRYDDDDRDDDRYDDDDRDDDRYDDDDRDDDRISDGSKTSEFFKREVKAETLGFQTEIKIEIEFVSNTTDTDQLIDQIIDKFSLTREEAEEELRIERSDDQRLEKKLEVEIEKRDNTSKVEVELETVIDSTSRGEILDAIVKNSQLTREQINEQLRFDSDDNDNNDFSRNEMRINSDSSELEKLRQENQQLRDEIKQLNQKLDDLQQIIMEQMKVIMDTLKNLKSQ
ncbi:hypothetical protein [Nitrosopumilus sp.]|uniref:hypothetical protein n=1 Tax=Nitrosopumilus sp. TaxID=2024843 RepID=UPI00292D4F0D|nr:hypothetical protein [Nitrosopumilus sp.]